MSTPVAQALKQHNENTTITWVVQPELSTLLEGNPYIDKVIPWNYNSLNQSWGKKNLIRCWSILNTLKKEFKEQQFDMTLDLQGTFTSALASWLSRSTHRISLGSEEGSGWLVTKTISRTQGDRVQIGSEYRYLITQLGMSDNSWKMHVPIKLEAKESAKNLLNQHIKKDKYVVLCPFSTHESKRWNNGYWQQIALRVRGRYHLRTILLGDKQDSSIATEISRSCGAVDLTGKTTLPEAAEIIKGAELLIGVDTGLTHMAHAVDTPTLALFGPTFPYAYAGQDNSNIIYQDRFCSPCNLSPTCKKQYQCMQEITPDKVLTEIKPIMQQK